MRHTLGPLFLLIVCPIAVQLFWYTFERLDGSIVNLYRDMSSHSFVHVLAESWVYPTNEVVSMIGLFIVFELVMLKIVPGAIYQGPVPRDGGKRPEYKCNGFIVFFLTLGAFIVPSMFGFYKLSVIVRNFSGLISAMNIFMILACVLLFLKGKLMPDTVKQTDNSGSNILFEYFYGVELHPQLFGVQLKQLVNARLGMNAWMLVLVSIAGYQYEEQNEVSWTVLSSVGIQFVYIAKHFLWEVGYFRSIDIYHDHFGFYLAWGTMVWMPVVHTAQTYFLLSRSPSSLAHLPWLPWAWVQVGLVSLVTVIGLVAVYVNYEADVQRLEVRDTAGKCMVWGKKPKLISAKYIDGHGKEQTNILLASGWLGVSRHFHYIPDLVYTFSITVFVGFNTLLPWLHFLYLFALFVDRINRVDTRCRRKYGKHWDEYCSAVPYKIMPGLY